MFVLQPGNKKRVRFANQAIKIAAIANNPASIALPYERREAKAGLLVVVTGAAEVVEAGATLLTVEAAEVVAGAAVVVVRAAEAVVLAAAEAEAEEEPPTLTTPRMPDILCQWDRNRVGETMISHHKSPRLLRETLQPSEPVQFNAPPLQCPPIVQI